MNKFNAGRVSLWVLTASMLLGAFFLGKTLTNAAAGAVGCISTGPQCGTDNGSENITVYTDYIGLCPAGYTYQNNGNWNQRCHRDANCSGGCETEHVTPTGIGCPDTYTQTGSGEGTVCSKTQTQSCQTGSIQYDSCPSEGTCPTTCGYEGGTVPDGRGGQKTCDATSACDVDQCINIDEFQGSVPEGYYQTETEKGLVCLAKTPVCNDAEATNYERLTDETYTDNTLCDYASPEPSATPGPADLCTNIDGVQTSVPDGMHINATGHECVNWELGGAPTGGAGGAVLGASTGGQVLGLATAGSFTESLYLAIMSLGGSLSAIGFKLLKKTSKVA
jgi:hypothetical protein